MGWLKVKDQASGHVLATQVKRADTFYTRLMGLMFTSGMHGYDGILFEPGNSIQTCFMRYPIDVVFLTEDNQVVQVVRQMKPWRFTRMYFKAVKALELKAGAVPMSVREGSRLEVGHV